MFPGEELDNVPEKQEGWEQILSIPVEQSRTNCWRLKTEQNGKYPDDNETSSILPNFVQVDSSSSSGIKDNQTTDPDQNVCGHLKKDVSCYNVGHQVR